ncbi:polysaccharide deacetylase family protein [Brevibacillus humidisoli]|uniref:polysaccharide deacetylase family protein n=1 Tax=Brevibacillus humidisoli TaxID=2895522 RepID=UPI001E410938|nr:polysaccharide deacetylase family protein [Brevibacillus humidisoli]UFJ42103.1 polysaccharide deacetylase family protein [Brevibacillus humidisoli]
MMRKSLVRFAQVIVLFVMVINAGCSLPVVQMEQGQEMIGGTGEKDVEQRSSPIAGDSESVASTASAASSEWSGATERSEAARQSAQQQTEPSAGEESHSANHATVTTEQTAEPPAVELVPYEGPVEHIFFHPLIAYPELAFDQDAMSKGYDDWFVTVSEFEKVIASLYEKNYILIDIHSLYERQTVEGKQVLQAAQLMLPEGKKPLILSIDDLNYYEYMRQNGNAYKLVLDAQNKIATYSRTPEGHEEIAYDNEIIPILDRFVEEHPDFSHQGAKGIIALTGYEGVLGYRTNLIDAPDYQQVKQEVMSVIQRLKETGWTFASHGYGHLDANKVSYQRLVADTARWKREVEPLLGPTSVYIYPYGSRVETGSKKHRYLIDAGFDVLCSVGPAPYRKQTPEVLMMDRRHIDGLAFKTQRDRLLPLFDSEQILDPIRPE